MEKWQKSSLSSSRVILVSNAALFVSSRNAPPKERGEALRDEPKTAVMEWREGGRFWCHLPYSGPSTECQEFD